MTQKEHDKYQNEYRECCMLLGNLDEKEINSVLVLLKALRQPVVSGTFCEKCNPNGIEDGNVIRCKKCGRGLALIEQNYH